MFIKKGDSAYALPSCADSFFDKYLDVFDEVHVIGESPKSYLDASKFIKINNSNISVDVIASNTHPKDFINDIKIRKDLSKIIKAAEAILIKPSSRKGMMAIEIAKKYHKPYMIELTGDIHNALVQNPSRLKRLYAPHLYRNIKKHIKDCKFGLYVSKSYLQEQFPIDGIQCGCADVVLSKSDINVLKQRIELIENKDYKRDIVNLCLIGFYQTNMKGIDTAIRSLSKLPQNYVLNVLGNGTKESQEKWFQYADRYGVRERIVFHDSVNGSSAVCEWMQGMDMMVFPTRSEGFGRVVAEALSQGLPCFATNICTMPELLPKTSLFDLDDDTELARLLIHYSENKEDLINLCKEEFEKAKEYDYERLRERRNAFLYQFLNYCEKYTLNDK